MVESAPTFLARAKLDARTSTTKWDQRSSGMSGGTRSERILDRTRTGTHVRRPLYLKLSQTGWQGDRPLRNRPPLTTVPDEGRQR